jgi:hypothetical protein
MNIIIKGKWQASGGGGARADPAHTTTPTSCVRRRIRMPRIIYESDDDEEEVYVDYDNYCLPDDVLVNHLAMIEYHIFGQ